jgi:hypothetical protein
LSLPSGYLFSKSTSAEFLLKSQFLPAQIQPTPAKFLLKPQLAPA